MLRSMCSGTTGSIASASTGRTSPACRRSSAGGGGPSGAPPAPPSVGRPPAPVDILIRPAPADASVDVFWDDRFNCERVDRPDVPGLPPFIGGWAGLFGYHLGRAFERQPPPRRDEFQVPDMAVGVYDWVVS